MHLLDGRVRYDARWDTYTMVAFASGSRAVFIDSSRRTIVTVLPPTPHLYRTGSLEWTGHHDRAVPTIGAWIAEMDSGQPSRRSPMR